MVTVRQGWDTLSGAAAKTLRKMSTRGGTRTRTPWGQRILSPPCLPFHHPGTISSRSGARRRPNQSSSFHAKTYQFITATEQISSIEQNVTIMRVIESKYLENIEVRRSIQAEDVETVRVTQVCCSCSHLSVGVSGATLIRHGADR